MVVIIEEGPRVERVGEGAQEQRRSWAEEVVGGTAENAEDGEAGVDDGIGIVGGGVVPLASTAKAGERIEHARTAQAHQAD